MEGVDNVYFLQMGNLVKIGYTSDLQRRMRNYPPDAKLLAIFPGGRTDEAMQHQRWSHLRKYRNEWFEASEEILEYADLISRGMRPDAVPDVNLADEASFSISGVGDIANVIRSMRIDAGLSQHDLAESAGVSRDYIVDLEKGKDNMHTRRVIEIMSILGVRLTPTKMSEAA